MQTFRSTVYIPLAELTHQSSQLLSVYAETQRFGESVLDNKALDRNWNFVAAPLRDAGMYPDGLHVVGTIRKLHLKSSRWAVYQRFKKFAWLDNQRLHAENYQLDNCEGSSAQLGLAIALLLNASNSPIRNAIATGSLSGEKHDDFDVAVAPVGSVPEKLDLLIEKRKHNALPDAPLYCFTPTYYKKHGELLPVAELAQIKQLAALKIEVKPIAWLSDAVKILKAEKTRTLKQDKWLGISAGITISLLLPLVLYRVWLHYPIPLRPLLGNHLAEPFQVCTNRDNSAVTYADLMRDGNIPILPLFSKDNSNSTVGLGFKAQASKTPFSNQYYLAFIHLGEHTKYKVISTHLNSQTAISVAPNETLEWFWPMQEPAKQQDNAFMVVLQRTPIAAIDIEQGLAKRFPDSKKSLDILQARDFLISQFPGSYAFSYKSIIRDNPCIKS